MMAGFCVFLDELLNFIFLNLNFSLVPSQVPDFSFKKSTDKIHVSFTKPKYFGSDTITIRLTCDNVPTITRTYSPLNVTTITLDEPCVKNLKCSVSPVIFALNLVTQNGIF